MAVKRVLNQNTKTWFYDFRIRGTRYRGAIPEARNKEQAEKAETRIRNDIFEGRFGGVCSSSKLKGFVQDVFLPWAKANRKSWNKDAPRVAPIVEFFGNKRFADISPFLIEKFKMERRSTPVLLARNAVTGKPVTRPRSVASVNRELSMLSRIFSLAIMNGEATANPCSKVRKLSGEQPRTRYLLPEEEQRLLAALTGSRSHLRPIVVLALNTGMRRGEILRLRWEHVDFHTNEIKATHTKAHRDRFIPMNSKVREELLLLRQTSKGELLFPARVNGSSLGDIKTAFNSACREAGIEGFRFHDLRHTFGTRAADAGVALTAVAAVMGHADIHTTMRYAHATDAGRRRVVEAVAIEAPQPENLVKIWSRKASGGERG
jgi:integrase